MDLWFDNRTEDTLWFPNSVMGVNAYQYDSQSNQWHSAQLYILLSVEHQKPVSIAPGCHGSYLLSVAEKLSPGPLRLLYIGSTDSQSPSVTGKVYANYVDIQVLPELYQPQAYKPVVQRC